METIIKTLFSCNEFYDIEQVEKILDQAKLMGLNSVDFEYREQSCTVEMICSFYEEC